MEKNLVLWLQVNVKVGTRVAFLEFQSIKGDLISLVPIPRGHHIHIGDNEIYTSKTGQVKRSFRAMYNCRIMTISVPIRDGEYFRCTVLMGTEDIQIVDIRGYNPHSMDDMIELTLQENGIAHVVPFPKSTNTCMTPEKVAALIPGAHFEEKYMFTSYSTNTVVSQVWGNDPCTRRRESICSSGAQTLYKETRTFYKNEKSWLFMLNGGFYDLFVGEAYYDKGKLMELLNITTSCKKEVGSIGIYTNRFEIPNQCCFSIEQFPITGKHSINSPLVDETLAMLDGITDSWYGNWDPCNLYKHTSRKEEVYYE